MTDNKTPGKKSTHETKVKGKKAVSEDLTATASGGFDSSSSSSPSNSDSKQPEKRLQSADIFKLVGLIVFFCLMGLIVYFLWQFFAEFFQSDAGFKESAYALRDHILAEGVAGAFILLGLQFLQIVVAFIPGEATQIAAGLLYGPWLGSLLIVIGCIVSSAFIFVLVRKLGAPFVQHVVPIKYLDKFRKFEETKKFNLIVFILFLIPGLPKDVFTYLVPLTDMKLKDFLILANVGRLPGIFASCYAADLILNEQYVTAGIIFAIAAGFALVAVIFRDKIFDLLEKFGNRVKQSRQK